MCPMFLILLNFLELESEPWFNIKMSSYQYRKSHCGDKTVVRSSYLHNGISYTGKLSSLYWIGPQNILERLGQYWWVGVGVFSNVVATFNHVGGFFNLFMATTCLNNPIFSNLGLCAACWAHFMYHRELWPTSVGHPFSFLNSSWGLVGGKYCHYYHYL